MLFFSIFSTSNDKNIPTSNMLNLKKFNTKLQWAVIDSAPSYSELLSITAHCNWIVKKIILLYSHQHSSLTSLFSGISSLSRWLWSSDGCCPAMIMGRGLMVQWLWSGRVIWFCGFGFVGLSSWVWVYGSGFVDHPLDRHGSLSWLAWIVDLIGVSHQLDRRGSLIVVVVVGIVVVGGRWWVGLLGWDNETKKERETVRSRGREDEKNKNKKGIKNNKEIIFKWSCQKNRSFDFECIIKWDVKCYKVVFWDAKC